MTTMTTKRRIIPPPFPATSPQVLIDQGMANRGTAVSSLAETSEQVEVRPLGLAPPPHRTLPSPRPSGSNQSVAVATVEQVEGKLCGMPLQACRLQLTRE